MVATKKFSEFSSGGDLQNDNTTVGLEAGDNVQFNNPWVFLPPGPTASRPPVASAIYYRLRLNTDSEEYEYYNPTLASWVTVSNNTFSAGPYVIYTDYPLFPDAFNLATLGSGLLKQTVALGIATLDLAIPGVDYLTPGTLTLPWSIADGGTGADNVTDARTNLGLGSMAVQDSSAVAITGGTITGLTTFQVGNLDFTGNTISATNVNGDVEIGLSGSGLFIIGGSVGINSVINDDTMASALATNIPTALSIKNYVDTVLSGFNVKDSCYAATTANLNATYNNGAAGVGATLTENVNGALSIDGQSPSVGQRVLVKDQSTTYENGIYVVSDAGSAGTPYILTRATDFDSSAEITAGSLTFIQNGTTLSNTSWIETQSVVTVGTDAILFQQFSASFPLSLGNGGTGAALVASNGGLVYSNASTLAILAGTATARQIPLSGASSAPSWSTATYPATTTINRILYSSAANTIDEITTVVSGVLVTDVVGIPSISTTLPSGLTIPDIKGLTVINDSTGNELLKFSAVASAVNELTLANAATGNAPILSATGSDSNIGIELLTKGTGAFALKSANTTTPITLSSGTTLQHITNFLFSDTANTRNITVPDASGTLALTSDLDWELITTATANNTSPVQAFINLAGYSQIFIVYQNMTPATNGSQIGLLASTDNGATFLTAASSYFWQVLAAINGTVAAGNSLVATYMQISSAISNGGNSGMFGALWVNNMTSTTNRKTVSSRCCHFNTAPTFLSYQCEGEIITTSAVNALEFATTGGNIATGQFYVYGVR